MEVSLEIGGSQLFLSVVVLVVSLVIVAFFTSSEASLMSVNKFRVRHRAQMGSKAAQAVTRVVGRHEKFFATILFTENAFIILASSIGTALAISILGEGSTSVVIATLAMTALIVTFGEITPKSLAARAADRWSLVVARPIELIMAVETPIIYMFTLLPRALMKLLGGEGRSGYPSISEGELRMLIDIAEEEGMMGRGEADMLEKVFDFGDRQVREVMSPRPEIVWVQNTKTIGQFLELYRQGPHSRFPVYQGDTENVVGILLAKDVLHTIAERGRDWDVSIEPLLRPAFFAPETKLVAPLLSEMRGSGHAMAIVVDEFGGIAGIVTLKQLVEEVVGPVGEEGAGPEGEFTAVDENTFVVDAGMRVDEANEQLDVGIPAGEYDTLAGFVLDQLGHIPLEGEHLHHGELRIEVTTMDKVRIVDLRVSREPKLSPMDDS